MTQGPRTTTTGIALALTILVHAGLAWWLLGLRETASKAESKALAVVWIERPAPTPPAAVDVPDVAIARPDVPLPAPAPSRRDALQAVEIDAAPVDAETRLPTAADLLAQAGQWARDQAPAADFAHDPLRRRVAPRAEGRFAMRRSISPEDVVKGIGQLLGGAGYTETPCPQIRRNIANLGIGGDAELAAEEIRRLQQYCL